LLHDFAMSIYDKKGNADDADLPDYADRSRRRELSSRKHKDFVVCACKGRFNALGTISVHPENPRDPRYPFVVDASLTPS
jgi:hypothetical protein